MQINKREAKINTDKIVLGAYKDLPAFVKKMDGKRDVNNNVVE